MGIYRKVHVKIWGDKKFRKLPNDTKLLFLYLLTGSHTTSLPGLSEAGVMQLAEVLGWDIQDFRDNLDILLKDEMVFFDDDARVLFIPNVIKHNSPANPNIVKGWRKVWDLIPESELKNRFINHVKPYMKQLGIPYIKSFSEGFAGCQTVCQTICQTIPNTEAGTEAETGTETEAGVKTQSAKKIEKKPKAKSKNEPAHPDKFDLFMRAYPKTHHNERLNIIQQWNISIRERGATPEQLIEAAQIYAGICKREGRIQKHIKGAQVFIGHKMAWKDILESGIRPDVSDVSELNVKDLTDWAENKEAEENKRETD